MQTLESKLQRLHWRFSQGKAFKPNANDIDALNVIIRSVTKDQERLIDENLVLQDMVSKLIADKYRKLIDHYNWLPGQKDICQKRIIESLDKHWDKFIEGITENLETNRLLKQKGSPSQDPFTNDEVEKNVTDIINHIVNLHAKGYCKPT